ncbi:hypothetical protein BPNPMPFG_002500 [Mesorhizobium sp. AR07]|uniref:hypothetical protein n=1 Tax=Mesorhizobium sp. AR07 TaxID=2865838 RepID=UPI0021607074|nr:hypothetical protein [Mesorhizobium sp. AR07]UVK46790.1 hypothetical protein BPNPMPFG_002500 [Mesorhizobium sp. AR07]
MGIAEALKLITDSRDVRGAPIRGKLTSLTLNIGPEGWQAIAQFWFCNSWNVSVGPDPVACIMEVLTTPPDISEPYEPRKWLAAAKPVLPAREQFFNGMQGGAAIEHQAAPALIDDDDLLV